VTRKKKVLKKAKVVVEVDQSVKSNIESEDHQLNQKLN